MSPRLASWLVLLLPTSASAGPVDFNRDVAPILLKRCAGCHNENESRGDLSLTTRDGLLKGGGSGAAAPGGCRCRTSLKR